MGDSLQIGRVEFGPESGRMVQTWASQVSEAERQELRLAFELQEKKFRLAIIQQFVAQVNELAERNIELTGKLEGSHYAAMTKILKDLEAEVS